MTQLRREPPIFCAECGRQLNTDTMQYRYDPTGDHREIVCSDQYTCEPTMDLIVGRMDQEASSHQGKEHRL